MKRYLRIYLLLLKLNFATLVEYRANFINSVLATITWGGMSVFSIYLLTARVSSVYGWTREELIFLTAVYNIVFGLFHMLFSRNFDRFSRVIHFGQLDSILVKPADSQFLLSFWFINYTSLIRIILGIVICLVLLHQFGITITFFTLLQFLLFLIVGVFIAYSVWFLFMPLTVWFTRLSNIVDLLYQINGLGRYPPEMVQNGFFLVILLPIFFVVATPTKILLQTVTIYDVLGSLCFAAILLVISRKFWQFALRFYTSASS